MRIKVRNSMSAAEQRRARMDRPRRIVEPFLAAKGRPAMNAIVITLTPCRDADGRARASRSGPRFDVTRQLVTGSPTPLFDAARVLLAEGTDPATPLMMRHAGGRL
jgi:hypothetical protein